VRAARRASPTRRLLCTVRGVLDSEAAAERPRCLDCRSTHVYPAHTPCQQSTNEQLQADEVTTAQRPSPQTVSTRPTAVNAAAGVCVPSRSRGRCSMLRNILHERFSSRRETACVPFMHRLCVQMFVHTHHHHTFPAQRQHCRHFSNSVDVRLRRLIIEVGGVQADSTPQPSHKGRRSPSSTSETRELGNLQHKLANISIFKFQDFFFFFFSSSSRSR
jgi:hypothetical protein